MPNYNISLICYIINPRTGAARDTSFSDQYIKLNYNLIAKFEIAFNCNIMCIGRLSFVKSRIVGRCIISLRFANFNREL